MQPVKAVYEEIKVELLLVAQEDIITASEEANWSPWY